MKDKEGIFPINLDTLVVYKKVEMNSNGELVYPKRNLSAKERSSFIDELNRGSYYLKFYSNGRCLKFTTLNDELGHSKILKDTDLNPNSVNSFPQYYYSSDGKTIEIEGFVYGDGKGYYVVSNYLIKDLGNSLIKEGRYTQSLYKKIKIPISWNTKYKIDG